MSNETNKPQENYTCTNCKNLILPDITKFKIGDEVLAFESIKKPSGIVNESCKPATIVEIKNEKVLLKIGNSHVKKEWSIFGITPKNAPTGIDYMRKKRCECA